MQARLRADSQAVLLYRRGLHACLETARSQPGLFPADRIADPPLLVEAEKDAVRTLWKRYLDYQIALDSILQYHASFHRLKGSPREDAFRVSQAAFLAQYRHALEFIDRADRNPRLETVLNEPAPELGLPQGSFGRTKQRFLNVAIATEFAARNLLLAAMPGSTTSNLNEGIQEDTRRIWNYGSGTGENLTARNALRIVQRTGAAAWFPVQKGVAEWMGDTKVLRSGRSLIKPQQIRDLRRMLLPGDVLLTRREWYLSNIGLPGFWPHAALYIGTPEERHRQFDTETLRGWVRAQGEPTGHFEALLKARAPGAYALSLRPLEQDHVARVIEAMSEGVCLTSLEHCADADSLAALRPRLPTTESALAILRAFQFVGRPYDFDFDFATDATLVCTEVVCKAYGPTVETQGLKLPLVDMLGRKVTPANEIARQFDAQTEAGQAQFSFVAFLDGHEPSGHARPSTMEAFRESWRRPKWHLLTQGQR